MLRDKKLAVKNFLTIEEVSTYDEKDTNMDKDSSCIAYVEPECNFKHTVAKQ